MKNFKRVLYFIILIISFEYTMAQETTQDWSSVKSVTIRLKPGEDLKQSIDAYINKNKIEAACVLTCVGSLQATALRFADKSETTTLTGKVEIVSLTGTLSVTGSHLHLAVSDGEGKTIGGHLKEGSIIYTTAEIVIGIFPGLSYTRETDSTYGYKELRVNKRLE